MGSILVPINMKPSGIERILSLVTGGKGDQLAMIDNGVLVIPSASSAAIEQAVKGEQWESVRKDREAMLSACDWTQIPDVPVTTQADWKAYRQALRDITTQADPANISWPTPPV